MLQKTINNLFNGMRPKPLPYNDVDILDAFRKIDRILDNAAIPAHVETAENMFCNMLKRYGLRANEEESAFVRAMQAKINACRARIYEEFEYNNSRIGAT